MKNHLKKFILTAVILGGLMTLDLYAPPTAAGAVSGGGANCWPPPCIPIDGGIAFLMAAGIAVGSKRLFMATK